MAEHGIFRLYFGTRLKTPRKINEGWVVGNTPHIMEPLYSLVSES